MGAMWRKGKLTAVLLLLQLLFIVLFGLFVDYDSTADAREASSHGNGDGSRSSSPDYKVDNFYPMFQDVHVMMFIGFGFLMTFLKRYGFGSIGYNFLIAAFVLQWSTLIGGFLHMHHGRITIDMVTLVTSDFAAAAVLISFGALLGKASIIQLVVMATVEVVCFSVNEWIGLTLFQAVDMGGSMFVHVFGAYFGLAAAWVLHNKDVSRAGHKEGAVYHSDIFAMIGTIFLWLYWPSFNSALAVGDARQRAVLNTYYSLAACVVVSFAISSLVNKSNKIDMVHVQNSTLAGGVAVGTTADMMIQPWGAMTIGSVSALLSVVGYRFITPCLSKKLKLHDTCGVNNLHGMPGILAGIGGIVAAAVATEAKYGSNLYSVFPAMGPVLNSTAYFDLQTEFGAVTPGDGRSAQHQALYQAAALGTTLLIALVTGALTGAIMRIPIWDGPKSSQLFDDSDYWLVEDGMPDADPESHVKLVEKGSGGGSTTSDYSDNTKI